MQEYSVKFKQFVSVILSNMHKSLTFRELLDYIVPCSADTYFIDPFPQWWKCKVDLGEIELKNGDY